MRLYNYLTNEKLVAASMAAFKLSDADLFIVYQTGNGLGLTKQSWLIRMALFSCLGGKLPGGVNADTG
jgi:hypothetical protein